MMIIPLLIMSVLRMNHGSISNCQIIWWDSLRLAHKLTSVTFMSCHCTCMLLLISPLTRYQIMLKCWQLKNSDRPTFSTLAEQLKQHYSDAMESNTFNPYLQLVI